MNRFVLHGVLISLFVCSACTFSDGLDAANDEALKVRRAGWCFGYETFTGKDQCDRENISEPWTCVGLGFQGHGIKWGGAELIIVPCASDCGNMNAIAPDCAAQG